MQHSDSHDTYAAWERLAPASLPLAMAVTRLPSVCIDCLLWTFHTSRIMPFMLFGERLSSLSCAFKSSSTLCWRRLFAPLLPNAVSLCVCRLLCTQASVHGRSGCFRPSAARRNTASRMCRESEIAQSCLTLCGPVDYTVHGILEARIPVWVAFPFSSKSSQPRDRTQVSRVAGGFFTS